MAAQREFHAVIHQDPNVSMRQRLQLPDPVNIYNGRAIGAKKRPRIQPGLELTDSSSKDMQRLTAVDSHVIALGFNPINVCCFDEQEPAIFFDHQASWVKRCCFQFFKQGENLSILDRGFVWASAARCSPTFQPRLVMSYFHPFCA